MAKYYYYPEWIYKRRAKKLAGYSRNELSHTEILNELATNIGFKDWNDLISNGEFKAGKDCLHEWELEADMESFTFNIPYPPEVLKEHYDEEGIDVPETLSEEDYMGPFWVMGAVVLNKETGEAGMNLDVESINNLNEPDAFSDFRHDMLMRSFGQTPTSYSWEAATQEVLGDVFKGLDEVDNGFKTIAFFVINDRDVEATCLINPSVKSIDPFIMSEAVKSMNLTLESMPDQYRLLTAMFEQIGKSPDNTKTYEQLKESLGIPPSTQAYPGLG